MAGRSVTTHQSRKLRSDGAPVPEKQEDYSRFDRVRKERGAQVPHEDSEVYEGTQFPRHTGRRDTSRELIQLRGMVERSAELDLR